MSRAARRGGSISKLTRPAAASRDFRVPGQFGKRARGERNNAPKGGFCPPEDWHEPLGGTRHHYRVIHQEAGEGFVHVLTEQEIRDRLQELPGWMVEDLEVVQLSKLTRKKLSFPCYGMQWGAAIYLYPMDESLIEYFPHPPRPAQEVEAGMFGAHWEQGEEGFWKLIWDEKSIKDFYLNNVLIHELGHLLDDRNNNYAARERYAEWFAIEYGYRPTRRKQLAAKAVKKTVQRRHHKA